MSLTIGTGPLARPSRGILNGDLWSVLPQHALYLHPVLSRIRGRFAGETVVDTRRAVMLHETGLLPRWYLPREDVRADLLEASATQSHCPFKGDAVYWHVRVGERRAVDAVWSYPETVTGAPPIGGLVSFHLDRLDTWLEEDEEVHGHPRDPFHRVDALRSSRHVVVRAGDVVLADTTQPVVLLETGLPVRFFVPDADVRTELLLPSDTRSACPYKGAGTYEHVALPGRTVEDAVWSYPSPLLEALPAAGHRCFLGDGITTTVDGVPA